MKKSEIYQKWKGVTDKIYSGELTPNQGTTALIELLAEDSIKLRANKTIPYQAVVFLFTIKATGKKIKKNPWGWAQYI